MVTKTSLMLGLGESDDQIMKVMEGETQGSYTGVPMFSFFDVKCS